MTQFFKTHCDSHGASRSGKLDVTVSIRTPDGDYHHDQHHEHGDDHGDCTRRHLPDTGVVAGSYGSATESAQFTVDAQGRLTAADSALITPAWNNVTDKPDTLAGSGITDALPASATAAAASKLDEIHAITATGDADWSVAFDGSADVAAPLTLANTGVVAGDYGSATEAAQVSIDAKGRITAAQVLPLTPDWRNIQHPPRHARRLRHYRRVAHECHRRCRQPTGQQPHPHGDR